MTYLPADGDLVTVTRTQPDGHASAWTGRISHQRESGFTLTAADGTVTGFVGSATAARLGELTQTVTPSIDPADHSIDLDGGPVSRTIEPGDEAVSCHVCSRRYKKGEWRLLLPDVRSRWGDQFHMHKECAEAIGAAVAHVPTAPAPWVDHS